MDNDTVNNTEDRETQVRQHAYRLWLEEGQPEGRADEHWRLATEAAARGEPRQAPPETHTPVEREAP